MGPPTSSSIQAFFPSTPAHSTATASTETPHTSPADAASYSHAHGSSSNDSQNCVVVGDGFTTEQIDAVLHPARHDTWRPPRAYAASGIARLATGPGGVVFRGRVANLALEVAPVAAASGGGTAGAARAARGCWRLVVKDDEGCVVVRLWYASREYVVRLGQIVTVWTTHIAHGEKGAFAASSVPLFTSIFPERDRSCHLRIQEVDSAEFTTPLEYERGIALPWLMTLANYQKGGDEVAHGRLIVCVKGIGSKRKVATKKGVSSDCVTVNVFDDTAEAQLSLWGVMTLSAAEWQVSHTILLLERVGCLVRGSYTTLTIVRSTLIDIDPDIPDAHWLRAFAQRMLKRDHVNPPFPDDVPIVGYLSLILTEINLVELHRRGRLLCNQCCGIPVYANDTSVSCKHCDTPVPLRPNPKIIGSALDETGCTSAGKLLLSPDAWTNLLSGRTLDELVGMDGEALRWVESRLLFLRVTMLFGWRAEEELAGEDGGGGEHLGVGRLWVVDVVL